MCGIELLRARRRQLLHDYVVARGGKRTIQRILISNNGLAAVKAIRSMRRWAHETFGDDHTLHFIAMATTEDLEANAEFIRLADEYVAVPGGSNNCNYANVQLIVDLAVQSKADAVWPGWGHASEYPRLPEELAAKAIAFIGPPAPAMRALGDKISSMLVAQTADVPCMAWSGSGLTVPLDNGKLDEASIPSDLYLQACIHDLEDGLAKAKEVGFPLMIKASEGGGGKGIRRVDQELTFQSAFDAVQREVPGSPIFLMRLATKARHLEVQVIADEYGNAMSIYGRDCSVQRRHQKIIEEAPVTVVPDLERWKAMEQAAVRLAQMVSYVNAGTVEFLYDSTEDKFSFLELNPRLQVEHPCSEMISDINLPATQLQIAMGIPLDNIDDIQCNRPNGNQRPPNGHVIACRITAENPDAGFKPGGGRLTDLVFRTCPNVWGYFSIAPSGSVHEYADSQFGHLFAKGNTREDAIKTMILALKELSIRADFRSTSEYLIRLLDHADFRQNNHTTAWLDDLIKEKFGGSKVDALLAVIAGACWRGKSTFDEREKSAKEMILRGQIPTNDTMDRCTTTSFIHDRIQYNLTVAKTDGDKLRLELNKTSIEVPVIGLVDGGLLVGPIRGQTLTVYGKDLPDGTRLSINGQTITIENESDPTVVRSPSPGKLIRYLVSEGADVAAGTVIAEIEVMKMYMSLAVGESGRITLTKAVNSSLEAGDVIARLALNDPSSVRRPHLCQDSFSALMETPDKPSLKMHQKWEISLKIIQRLVFGGYPINEKVAEVAMNDFLTLSTDADLPFHLLRDQFSNYASRLPAFLSDQIDDILHQIKSHRMSFSSSRSFVNPLPSLKTLYATLQKGVEECDARDAPAYVALLNVIRPHLNGPWLFAEQVIADMLGKLEVDCTLFDGSSVDDVLLQKMKHGGGGIEEYFRLFCMQRSLERFSPFVAKFMLASTKALNGHLNPKGPFLTILKKLTRLTNRSFSRIVQAARESIMLHHLPSIESLRLEMEDKLRSFGNGLDRKKFIREFVSGFSFQVDVLPSFFLHPDEGVRALAMEIYIQRIFEAFEMFETGVSPSGFLTWRVSAPPAALLPQTSTNYCSYVYEMRAGAFGCFSSPEEAKAGLASLITSLEPHMSTKNLLYVAIPFVADPGMNGMDEAISKEWEEVLLQHRTLLEKHQIQRFALLTVEEDAMVVGYHTFRQQLDWKEDCQVRHIEPAMSYLLELPRVAHHYKFRLCHADPSGQIHIYMAEAPDGAMRLFTRVLIRPKQTMRGHETLPALIIDSKGLFALALDHLAMVQSKFARPLDCNHLFVSVLNTFRADPTAASDLFLSLMDEFEDKLLKLRIMEGEIKVNLQFKKDDPVERYRFFLWNETGFIHRITCYRELKDCENGPARLVSLDGKGDRHGLPVNAPHPLVTEVQRKRIQANALETSYVYDFPMIFQRGIELMWSALGKNAPFDCFKAVELVLRDPHSTTLELTEVIREAGMNDIGMVAWKMIIKTPFHPQGRTIIVIANDIIHGIGAFGLAEDRLFAAASRLARKHGWPRVFLSVNSGARIALAEELRSLIRAKWIDPLDPSKGFEYLYLEEADYRSIQGKNLCKVLHDSTLKHYRITDILGGLGVENLSGSGMIAGETSLAYTETFTITFVTGRSVGIGAYLVRLGQRVIQKQSQPIILTGVQALNQLLGREVYKSNLQIGGPQIMAFNGVAHQVVRNDLEGVQAILRWIEFVPSTPIRGLLEGAQGNNGDDPERFLCFTPPADGKSYDPRQLVTGSNSLDLGLLDRGSFVEVQEAWARSVIVGRGRLGGLPVAVLMVETRTTQTLIPADPASPSSESTTLSQAGQVWYPDSAFKTAQFIKDCNYGERLPLIILANWRGFSGGQRDLFDEILKFGSYIVDALREYQPPVFIYLPPHAQLRGGSWVVVDSTINPESIEMYADPTARGGILEPEGLVAIKFKPPQLKTLVKQIIPRADQLDQDRLIPVAHQVACTFADLHDRPGRMKELGVIRAIVPWREARRFFYHRLRVRLWQMALVDRALSICKTPHKDGTPFKKQLLTVVEEEWLPALGVDPSSASDQQIADTLSKHAETVERQLQEWCHQQLTTSLLHQAINNLSLSDRLELIQKLTESINPNGEGHLSK